MNAIQTENTKMPKNNYPDFTIIIDTREQRPYLFKGYPIFQQALPAGDYSIRGFETFIAIERKQAEEVYLNFGHGRERFMRECEKLSSYERKAIIIENDFERLVNPPDYTRAKYKMKLKRSHIMGSLAKLIGEYGIPVIFASGRREGNELTFAILKQYYKCKREGRKIREPSVWIRTKETMGLPAEEAEYELNELKIGEHNE